MFLMVQMSNTYNELNNKRNIKSILKWISGETHTTSDLEYNSEFFFTHSNYSSAFNPVHAMKQPFTHTRGQHLAHLPSMFGSPSHGSQG